MRRLPPRSTLTDSRLPYTTLFRSSNISAGVASQYDPVPQESVLAYELGAKVQLVPGILRVNGALFYYDYSNKQLLGTVPVPVLVRLSSLVSVPKSHVQGAELDVELRPVTALSLRVSGTYVETKVDRKSTRLNSSHYCATR